MNRYEDRLEKEADKPEVLGGGGRVCGSAAARVWRIGKRCGAGVRHHNGGRVFDRLYHRRRAG